MNDLKPFQHGEDGTHSVCNKHNIGYKSACCECSGRGDCREMTMKPKQDDWEKDFQTLFGKPPMERNGKFNYTQGHVKAFIQDLVDVERENISTSIDQAVAEERARLRAEIENMKKKYNKVPTNVVNVGKMVVLTTLLAYLDKPKTDKEIL